MQEKLGGKQNINIGGEMYKSSVVGKGGIIARVVADSVSSVNGKRITTFEVEFPRYILSEANTHRLHSRNAASTRAIPLLKQIQMISDNPAMPIYYGKSQPGMQAGEELDSANRYKAESIIKEMMEFCSKKVKILNEIGLHKQHAGRYLEPWAWVKGVITATEYDNFFWLRVHEDAQPEIYELARCMKEAMDGSEQEVLRPGEWHTPYVGHMADEFENLSYYVDNNGHTEMLTLEEALKVSSSCCAQVSFRLLNNSKDKAIDIYNKLVESKPVHSSPFEHQATPIENKLDWWETEGTTHIDKYENIWSGNLKGWIQHRQLIPENTYWG